MINTSTTVSNILFQAQRYRSLWERVSAPMKQGLAGIWYSQGDSPGHVLRMDARGSFQIENLGTGKRAQGEVQIVPRNGHHYVVFLSEDGGSAARLLVASDTTLRLEWLDSSERTEYRKPADYN
ncbi:MAG: hypothetical protein AB1725_05480 [Armatimonadota bacterium]